MVGETIKELGSETAMEMIRTKAIEARWSHLTLRSQMNAITIKISKVRAAAKGV